MLLVQNSYATNVELRIIACIYVCMYARMCTCTFTYVHTCTFMNVCVHVHVRTHVYVCTFMFASTLHCELDT